MASQKNKNLTEKSTLHYYFLQAMGYPVAGRYPNTPNKSSDLLPVHQLEENIPNGAVLHHHWFLQGTPYTFAGKYPKRNRKKAAMRIRIAVAALEKGEDIAMVAERLFRE